jgi:hypothetical protein
LRPRELNVAPLISASAEPSKWAPIAGTDARGGSHGGAAISVVASAVNNMEIAVKFAAKPIAFAIVFLP